jgi:hypothetical protein
MLGRQSWFIICSFVILAIAITGICLAVTPAAASALQNTPVTYNGTLATNMHTEEVDLNAPPLEAQVTTRPAKDTCLLCYSPSHTLWSRLSVWMGK